ncbi:BnaC03g54710D [Brassica napus]|uniref:BnaC03g54710D protein n=1 Tax=Brassica napus TaxID=3708 RepID=A0A078F5M1_BRANA|nr:BnaC03g54710D [Brassica napus]
MWQWRREEVSCEILPRNRIIRRYKNDVYGNGKGCNLGENLTRDEPDKGSRQSKGAILISD